jgi:hypothetical protein
MSLRAWRSRNGEAAARVREGLHPEPHRTTGATAATLTQPTPSHRLPG